MSSVLICDKKFNNSQNCGQINNFIREIFTYGKFNILRILPHDIKNMLLALLDICEPKFCKNKATIFFYKIYNCNFLTFNFLENINIIKIDNDEYDINYYQNIFYFFNLLVNLVLKMNIGIV